MITRTFQKHILNVYGKKGEEWLSMLPDILNQVIVKWGLTEIIPYSNLIYNYVCSAYSQVYGNRKVVLKIGCFKNQIQGEANSLSFYNGLACLKLLDFDVGLNSLLMENIEPGYSLKKLFPLQDDNAIDQTVQIIKKLHTGVIIKDNSLFPDIEKILKALDNANYNIVPIKYVEKAKQTASKLLATQLNIVLLHGDLHHENMLYNQKGWVAIDPKGFVGESAFEVGAYMRNPIPELLEHKNHCRIICDRLNKFSVLLNIERMRLKNWSFVQAILAACWAGEDINIAHYMIYFADILDNME